LSSECQSEQLVVLSTFETINLKLKYIDLSAMTVKTVNAKGKND